jgi:hypothetical protein
MKHLNNNKLVSIAIRTTGPMPFYHDLVEISAIAVNDEIKYDKRIIPYSLIIQPCRLENIDWKELKDYTIADNNLDYRSFKLNKKHLERYINKGMEYSLAGDLFIDWIEKLGLPFRKRIVPMVHDWAFTKPFLIDWLGEKTVDLYFDKRYRDLQVCSLFMNDRASYRDDATWPFAKNNFKYLCSQMKVENNFNNTLVDAHSMIQVYQRMCKTFF